MKKYLTITGIGITLFVLVFFTWQYFATKNMSSNGNYLGSYYKGNYVWGGAMNLAWNNLNENILKEKLQLNTMDKIALEMVSKLNDAPFSKDDLDEESYYIKSGFVQSTVDEINRESKKKFPSKSFSDLQINAQHPKDIISYAYFLKEVEYETKFKEDTVLFNGENVKGFIASNRPQRENVKILKYESDDKFIIKLQLKDKNDELILAKGFDMKNPQDIVNEVNKNNHKNLRTIGSDDRFRAPKLHLDHSRSYVELLKIPLANKDFKDYMIKEMFEKIKFDMDEKGAKVENEAVIQASIPISIRSNEQPKIKNFILDKPYWVIMKRADSQNPYFILGVNNVELMETK